MINPEEMTDEEIEAFNKAEQKKQEARMKRQEKNRAKPKAVKGRDTAVVRGIKGKDCVKCIALRKIGLDDNETSDINEKIKIPREVARKLQEAGAIRIDI